MSQVSVIRVINPFEPSDHIREQWDFDPENPKTLRDFFPVIMPEHIVSINGKIVADKDFNTHYVQEDDNLVICPVPTGGGGGDNSKMVLRLVAMIAVMIIAPYLAGPAGMGLTGTAYTSAVMGMTLAGGMLVNALLPNKPLSSDSGMEDPGQSATYGVDGPKNTSLEGIPVPVGFGTHRFAGNLISLYTENLGDSQNLYMLFNAGEGVVAGITDIEVNGQPVANYNGLWESRLGLSDQTPIPWFSDIITPHNYNQKLNAAEDHFYTSVDPIDKIRFDVVFPGGLYQVNSSTGKYESFTVWTEWWYRKTGTLTWLPLPVAEIVSGPGSVSYGIMTSIWPTISLNWVTILPAGYVAVNVENTAILSDAIIKTDGTFAGVWQRKAAYGSTNGRVDFNERFTQSLRRSITSTELPDGTTTYDFKFRRASVDESPTAQPWAVIDDIWLSDINEIVVDDIAYNNTALLALKVKITDQLSGIPNVTFLHGGMVCNWWDYHDNTWKVGPTDNPAWITYAMMTDPRWGGDIPEDRINIEQWKAWSIHCHMEVLRFNGIFDTASNLWDALQYVFRAGHAAPVMVGTRYGIAVEKATEPSMMFSVANMIEGSFKETWTPIAERVNEIDVSYYDKTDGYKQKTLKVVDQAAQDAGIVRNTSVTLFGIVETERAYREGLMMLNMNKYIKQSVEWASPVEAIACTVGDTVYVQHDMPSWGYAGRVEQSLALNRITLDREVPWEAPFSYKFLALLDSVQRHTGTISSMPSGNWLNITGVNSLMKVKRVKIGTLAEVRVVACYSNAIEIEDQGAPIGGWVGQTAILFDTDVIEERDVANVVGNDVVLTAPLSAAPNIYGQWMYGETAKVKKPFRIQSITGSDFHERTIAAIEYNESVYPLYGTPYPTPNFSDLDPLVQHVTILGTYEELIKIGAAISTHVTVMWNWSQETYVKAEVYVSVANGPYFSVGYHADRYGMDANDGTLLKFKVVGMDALGQRAAFNTAPEYVHTVIGKTAKPQDVTGLSGIEYVNGIQLNWTAVTDLDLRGYEVRVGGTDWATATIVVQNFAGTSFMDQKRVAGSWVYRVKAVDVLGNYSNAAVSFTVVVAAMAAVTGFAAALQQRQIVMSWNAITDPNLRGYEIRVGPTSWETATPVITNYNGTNYAENRRVPGTYKYWIASVSTLNQYSTPASYTLVVPQIAAPTGLVAEARVGDILVSWTGVNDIDLKGYEIRVGSGWDVGEVLITGFLGTSFVDGKRDSGTYHYMVKAFGSPGNESASLAAYDLVLVPPASVTGFDCVQNGNRIEFRWNPNPETDLIGYEIREGQSWSSGVKVVEQLGTSFTMPSSSIAADRTFWIKAIIEPGIPSTSAVFSTTAVAAPSDRNVVFTQDEFVGGFTGNKYNMTVVSTKLQLNAGQSYGEYTFAVTLPQLYRARNSLAVGFDAIIPDTETWTTATYPWNSTQAARSWTLAGDLGQIGVQFYISKFTSLDVAYLDGWSLNNTTTSENGTVAAVATNVTYAPGRYLNGVKVAPTTTLSWTKTVAQYFNATFWARIDDTAGATRQVFWKASVTGGASWIDVSYNPSTVKFELRDHNSATIQVTPPGTFAIGDQIMFGVVQTASGRKFYVGQVGKGTAEGSSATAAIGAIATIQLHP